MKNYILTEDNGRENHAGSKARNDIEKIVLNQKYIPVTIRKYKLDGPLSRVQQVGVVFADWMRLLKMLDKGSCLLLQIPVTYGKMYVPFYLKLIKKLKNLRIIMLIHDLDAIRELEKNEQREINFLKIADFIICHNDKMKQVLINKSINSRSLFSLGIFDYIAESSLKKNRRSLSSQVIIAGNLMPGKAQYIYKLQAVKGDTIFNLYGPNYESDTQVSTIKYHGQFGPEELLDKLQGSFGLVWDGDEIETCSGFMGAYLKVNNPHKTSLYLAAGIPVIVWSQSAMAEFVLKENIGITVESLNDISEAIKKIGEHDYQVMVKNASGVSKKLRNGFYTATVLAKALSSKQ